MDTNTNTNTPIVEGSELLDETRLATKLAVSRKTLQSWRYAAKGPRFIKVGRLIRYRTSDVDTYLRGQTRGAMSIVR